MKKHIANLKQGSFLRAIVIIAGIAANVLLAFAAEKYGLPLYLDTVGTIAVSYAAGLFPGIITAVLTNLCCSTFIDGAVYFGFINASIAIFTVWFSRDRSLRRVSSMIVFTLVTGLFSGIVSAMVQWAVFKGVQSESVSVLVDTLEPTAGMSRFPLFLVVNSMLNCFDKGLCLCLAMLILCLVSKETWGAIQNERWRQRPLTRAEEKELQAWGKDVRRSASVRTTIVLLGGSLLLVVVIGMIGVRMYFEIAKAEKTEIAMNAVRFAADVVDPDKIDRYIRDGEEAPGYKETEDMLYRIRDNAAGVEYLYILKVSREGSTFIFDLDAKKGYGEYGYDGDAEGYEPGDFVPIEDAFAPYLDALLAGEEVEPIESNGNWNWIETVYYPVRNEHGQCVCYAGADVSLSYIADYMRDFLLRTVFAMGGFFMLIVAYGLWTTRTYTVYPIKKIAMCVEGFERAGDDPDKLAGAVDDLNDIDIHTGDEVEKLYHEICDMARQQSEQLRSIQRFSENTSRMQDGLIITMADLVENRDSDTGAHIQKTAAYVKIIAEGLKKKGYYSEKLTPKFMSDVVRSAPLHDVGKINISDKILNKPGRLTDEEYEIMKTHTIAGKNIIEKAINTMEGGNYLKEARNMAAYHHERWDGKGYPEGLRGEVIPLSARIMAVADVFDALASPRIYKPPFPLEKALDIIQEGAGSQFDPKCVEVFMESLPAVKVVLKKYNQYE